MPISLHVSFLDWGPKPFKAFNSWLQEKNVLKITESIQQGMIDSDVFSNLRKFKASLKEWNRKSNDNLNTEITQAKNLLEVLDNGMAGPKKKMVMEKLHALYEKRICYLKQKSRILWPHHANTNS